MSELHPVVELLVARMETNPEEFERGMSRWNWMLEGVMTNCSEEERAALHAGLRPIRLQQLHEDVLDELLNGPERRAQEDQMVQQMAQQQAYEHLKQQAQMAQQQRVPSRHPKSSDMEKNGIMNALRNIIK